MTHRVDTISIGDSILRSENAETQRARCKPDLLPEWGRSDLWKESIQPW